MGAQKLWIQGNFCWKNYVSISIKMRRQTLKLSIQRRTILKNGLVFLQLGGLRVYRAICNLMDSRFLDPKDEWVFPITLNEW